MHLRFSRVFVLRLVGIGLVGLGLGLALVSPALALPPSPAIPAPPKLTVLRAARLFDGRGARLTKNAVVIVEGTRIKAVGSGLAVPAGATLIDLGDVTLLPGFVDAHTHITGEASDNWYKDAVENLRRSVPAVTLRAVELARRTLMAGVTTVRNVGSDEFVDVALRDAIAAGTVPGPRVQAGAYALGARGGHCDSTGYPYERFGPEPGLKDGIASGADGFRDAVRMQVKYGADVIKVCATGGVLSLKDDVDTPQLTLDELRAIVEEAHALRRKTAAHAHGAAGAKLAIRAGIDSIEHGTFLDAEGLRLMKQRGTVLVPTALAVDSVSRRSGGYPPEIGVKARAAARAHSATLRRAVKAGVKIAFGTDAGVNPHGVNAREFGLLVSRGGMTPAQALRTTQTSAELLGIGKLVGTLETGKEADIVAVPGNPLEDIRVTERVKFVMKAGRIYLGER